MKKITITKTIKETKILKNSINGGPRFQIIFNDNTSAITKSDTPLGYQIPLTGWENKTKTFKAHYTKNYNLILDELEQNK